MLPTVKAASSVIAVPPDPAPDLIFTSSALEVAPITLPDPSTICVFCEPSLCFVEVAAVEGKGRDAAEIGKAVPEAMPCTLITSALELPAVPRAGCLAAVAAPVGRETVPETLVMFQVPDCAACVAKVPALVTAWLATVTVPGSTRSAPPVVRESGEVWPVV